MAPHTGCHHYVCTLQTHVPSRPLSLPRICRHLPVSAVPFHLPCRPFSTLHTSRRHLNIEHLFHVFYSLVRFIPLHKTNLHPFSLVPVLPLSHDRFALSPNHKRILQPSVPLFLRFRSKNQAQNQFPQILFKDSASFAPNKLFPIV